MRFAKTAAALVFTVAIATSSSLWAQCQGGRQNSGGSLTSTPYNQTALMGGYNQNTLNPLGYSQNTLNSNYNQNPLANLVAMEQYNRNMQMQRAMQVQAQSAQLRAQITQAQTMRKEMMKASAEKRKAAEKERAENLALREEREAARRAKYNVSESSVTRLTSVQ